jgi:hypothetical protein
MRAGIVDSEFMQFELAVSREFFDEADLSEYDDYEEGDEEFYVPGSDLYMDQLKHAIFWDIMEK